MQVACGAAHMCACAGGMRHAWPSSCCAQHTLSTAHPGCRAVRRHLELVGPSVPAPTHAARKAQAVAGRQEAMDRLMAGVPEAAAAASGAPARPEALQLHHLQPLQPCDQAPLSLQHHAPTPHQQRAAWGGPQSARAVREAEAQRRQEAFTRLMSTPLLTPHAPPPTPAAGAQGEAGPSAGPASLLPQQQAAPLGLGEAVQGPGAAGSSSSSSSSLPQPRHARLGEPMGIIHELPNGSSTHEGPGPASSTAGTAGSSGLEGAGPGGAGPQGTGAPAAAVLADCSLQAAGELLGAIRTRQLLQAQKHGQRLQEAAQQQGLPP